MHEKGPRRAGDLIFLATAACVYLRLFFAVDFVDESFYVALPYAFELGHRPIVDELGTHQLGGLLLRPFVSLHLAIVGSSNGLVLCVRHLYFAFSLGSALLARGFLGRIFGSAVGSLAGAVSVAYVPFLIPSISYNTIAYLGLLSGSLQLASGCQPRGRNIRLCSGTALLAAATFAYPPMLLAAVTALACATWALWIESDRESRRHAVLAIGLTGAACLGVALATLVLLGAPGELERILELNRALGKQGGGSEKLRALVREATLERSYLLALAALVVTIAVCFRRISNRWLLGAIAVAAGPALLVLDSLYVRFNQPYTTSSFVFSAIGLSALPAVLDLRRAIPHHHWRALIVVTVPALVASASILWASANGMRNAALGLLPATLVAIACLSHAVAGRARAGSGSERGGQSPNRLAAQAPIFLLVSSLLGFLGSQMWTHSYNDAPAWTLRARVGDGPWTGILTEPTRRSFIETLAADLRGARGESSTIIFLDYFPAGYLMTDLKPQTPSLWTFPAVRGLWGSEASREFYARELKDRGALPDLVVRIYCFPMTHGVMTIPQNERDPVLVQLAVYDYEVVVRQPCYSITRRIQRE